MNRLLAVVFFVPLVLAAAEPSHTPLPLRHPVQDKNFFVLSLMERTPAVANDAELKTLLAAKRDALHKAATACEPNVDCFATAMRWSDAEVAEAAQALRHLFDSDQAVREMTDGVLRRSGAYVGYEGKKGDELLAASWLDAAKGINNIIDVYGTGKPPRSPNIDAVSFDVKNEAYVQMVGTVAATLDEQNAAFRLFFQPSLRFALYLLQINHRDEAGRQEPLEARENSAAVRSIKTIPWKKYPYSAIVLLGSGPDRLTWSLSPQAKLRAEIAARRYKEGKAPLIIVSGGYAHPNQTPYCEAIEMKKSLIADFGVPPRAIIID